MSWHGIAVGILLLTVLIYIGLLVWDVKHDIHNAPREPMLVCDKHGPFHSKYAVNLEGVTGTPIQRCPFCFEEAFKQARKNLKL